MSRKARIVVESNGVVLCSSDSQVTLGARTGCDAVIDDPLLAARHCSITWDGTFQLRDLGSVTGTWLDGRRATAFAELHDQSQIVVGASRLVVRIEGSGNARTLLLDLQRGAFWWKKPGKGVFDNDPDAFVRSEVAFGAYPLLRLVNRVAALVAAVVLVGALLTGAVFEPLVDAGPLVPAHAFVRTLGPNAQGVHAALAACAKIADEQGCRACHEPGGGVPAKKCMQCHGDLKAEATRRHPWFKDGEIGPVPGMVPDEGFCAICHRDHDGANFLKAASSDLVGKCEACHQEGDKPLDRGALIARGAEKALDWRERPHSTIAFPHDRHAGEMRCDLCHRPASPAPAVDDPDRHDFAEVPFETCAACHVPGAAASAGMTGDEQAKWRAAAKDHQWPVRWHGTDDASKGCAACHAGGDGDGAAAHGPAMKTVERPDETAEQYAAGRATYVAGRRMHDDEFTAHAAGRRCVECHVRGTLVASAPRPAATFWHALHLGESGVSPLPGNAGAMSRDDRIGCISCHSDLRRAQALRPAGEGAFAWPTDEASQAACKGCHSDGKQANELRATGHQVPPDRRRKAIAFPHGPHVDSAQFGIPGSVLADGCFACHEFSAPAGGTPLQVVPRTKPKAADCTQCHADHDHVGGGSCGKCHPAAEGKADSFTLAARMTTPAPPQRRWPAANAFSHGSPGHSGTDLDGKPITCALCHDDGATKAAKTIGTVPVPDEGHGACRQCHLRRQFHWR